jgi:hypothetical protein
LVGAVTIGAIDKSSVTPSALGAATPTDVTTAVDNIQIGGRNLMRNSAFNGLSQIMARGSFTAQVNSTDNVLGNNSLQFSGNAHEGDILTKLTTMSTGVQYIASFYAKSISGDNVLKIETHGQSPLSSFNLTTSWAKYTMSFVGSSTVPENPYLYFYFGSATGVALISSIKVEEGTKATDWSPAPEYVDANIATAQSTADAALTRNNTMAVKLGYTGYDALASAAALGHTLIDGGMINTVLINASAVVTNGLTANCITANMISAGSITADKIATNTITADKIAANTITADKIATKSITFDKLFGTDITALGNVTAGSFNIGSGKYIVTPDGYLTATGANITGNIYTNILNYNPNIVDANGILQCACIAGFGDYIMPYLGITSIREVIFHNPIITSDPYPTNLTGENSNVKFLKKGLKISSATSTLSINGVGRFIGVRSNGITYWIYDIDTTPLF